MDKHWMQITNVLDPIYQKGVQEFLTFAFKGKDANCELACPCNNCNNFDFHTKKVIDVHLSINGIVKDYDTWVYHGEEFGDDSDDSDDNMNVTEEDKECDDIPQLLDDIGMANFGHGWRNEENINESNEGKEGEAARFLRLLSEAEKELYPGCKNYSKLAFIVNMFHMKTMNKWTCKSIDMLLKFLKLVFPMAEIPTSFYEAKNFIRDLGLKCEKIHACENDCILYRKEYEGLDHCPNCEAPRYKYSTSKVPRKVVRYFPLKTRLQRLFVNREIARDMRWDVEKKVNDENVLRHPSDSEAWKEFDKNHESFALDPRNVRLGLASDGFNPFGNMSSTYSIWPVILVPYNLPPWKCLKDPFFMLSLLIPGPKSPGSEIDVFLQPLIDDLKELWEIGIDTYDLYTGKNFQLRTACCGQLMTSQHMHIYQGRVQKDIKHVQFVWVRQLVHIYAIVKNVVTWDIVVFYL